MILFQQKWIWGTKLGLLSAKADLIVEQTTFMFSTCYASFNLFAALGR